MNAQPLSELHVIIWLIPPPVHHLNYFKNIKEDFDLIKLKIRSVPILHDSPQCAVISAGCQSCKKFEMTQTKL